MSSLIHSIKTMRSKPTIAVTTRHVLTFGMITHKIWHYSDVIMNAMPSQVTGVSTVSSTVYWAESSKFSFHWPLWGESIGYWLPVDFPSQRIGDGELFPLDYVIMEKQYDIWVRSLINAYIYLTIWWYIKCNYITCTRKFMPYALSSQTTAAKHVL